MKEKIHIESSKVHFEIAEERNEIHKQEKDADKKIALRTVAAQNYFYAIVNAIEAVFARNGIHSFNHESRSRNIIAKPELFTEETVQLFDLVDRDQRNKVAYRGENSEKYQNIRKLAKKLMESIC